MMGARWRGIDGMDRWYRACILLSICALTFGSSPPTPATLQAAQYPNDPLFRLQWALHNTGQHGGKPGADIHVLEAWNITRCSPRMVIAILDTGIDPHHPDLSGKLVPGATFATGTESTSDDHCVSRRAGHCQATRTIPRR